MRIVYFLPDIDAGVAQIVKTILKYRPRNKDQYIVVLFSMKEKESNHPVVDFEGSSEIIRFSYSQRENLYAVYKRLAHVLHSEQDVIVSNDGWEIRMLAALKLKNPVVYIVHGDFNYYYLICKVNQGVIDSFIAYSTKVFEELTLSGKTLDSENHHKVHKIYYPSSVLVDPSAVQRRDTPNLKILFAGTLDERKGAHLLKEIHNSLSLQIDNFHLLILGDGVCGEQLLREFAGCNNVSIEGWKPNQYVIRKMSEADIFLFPSSSEGLPNVLIEALSMGAVPVASRLESGVMDVIEDGVNGCLVETGNIKGYVDTIVTLYKDRKLLDKLRQNGIRGLKEKFEPYRQAALYDEAIKRAASQTIKKDYPKYVIGRWLNQPWLPNALVKIVRNVADHPKL